MLDTLCGIPLKDDAGKSPDFLELLTKHNPRTYSWVGNSDCAVRDFEDSQTMVHEKCVPYYS